MVDINIYDVRMFLTLWEMYWKYEKLQTLFPSFYEFIKEVKNDFKDFVELFKNISNELKL